MLVVDVRWWCGTAGALLMRAGPLTAYLTETIVEDARRAAPGTRMSLTILAGTPPEQLAPLLAALARLAGRGIHVHIRRRQAAAA
jgi:hypothetical protein